MIKKNCGSELLIPKSEWVPEKQIQGAEVKTLYSPIIQKAFDRILEDFKPSHDVCLVSLCSSTRPYSKSRKWKKFKELYADSCDLIICSNGGIIPIQYEECYPYMTYDAHGEKMYDEVYIRITAQRLLKFFELKHYKKIVFNFRPKLRNRKAALIFKEQFKGGSEVIIVPTVEAYKKDKEASFSPSGGRYPDLAENCLLEIERSVMK